MTPRACLVTGALLPWTGGPVRSVSAFQRALSADVISFVDHRNADKDMLSAIGARRVVVKSISVPGNRHFLMPLPDQLRAASAVLRDADLVSCHSFYLFHPLWLSTVSLPKKPPYWFVPHGILDPVVREGRQAFKEVYQVLARRFVAGAAATVFSTVRERDKALAVQRIANPTVVHWPVELARQADASEARQFLRERLGLPPDARVLLCLGRLDRIKRPLDVIAMFGRSRRPGWHLVFVGPIETVTAADCRRAAKDVGAESRVHVIPGVPPTEAKKLAGAADVFISYSMKENFNNAAAEALAAGVPLLLSEGNDLLPEVSPTGAVRILSENRCDAVRVMDEVLGMTDMELRQRGQAGREWAAAHLSFDEFCRRLTELRDLVVQRR
jgi:glycosyltransferase involved in cell wall biosynthesis